MKLAHSLTVFDAHFERQTSDVLENNIKYINKKKVCIDLLAFRQGGSSEGNKDKRNFGLIGRTVSTVI